MNQQQNSLLKQLPNNLTVIKLEQIGENIVIVKFNRPKKLNAFNPQLFDELKLTFLALDQVDNLRCVILAAEGKHFTSGLDLLENMDTLAADVEDQARSSLKILNVIKNWQGCINAIQDLHVPVIAAIQGYCIGAGVDIITGCDIRICSENVKFSIKEIDIGIAADLGTLQRLPLIVGNQSLIRELAYTGRMWDSKESLQMGLVSQVTKEENLLQSAIKLAEIIASKSPIGINANKKVLNANNKSKINKGLEYVALLNMSQIFTKDVKEAATASLAKRQAKFSKL